MAPVKVISISAAVLALVAFAARRRLMVVTAYGSSMEPTFPTGTRLLVVRTRRVRTGDIVVLQHQDGERPGDAFASDFLVKRLAATPGDQVPASVAAVVDADDGGLVPPGMAVVLGDAEDSTDSRAWGYVPLGDVVGRSIRQLPGREAVEPEPST